MDGLVLPLQWFSVLVKWIEILFLAMHPSSSNYWMLIFSPTMIGRKHHFISSKMAAVVVCCLCNGSRSWWNGLKYCFLQCIRLHRITGIFPFPKVHFNQKETLKAVPQNRIKSNVHKSYFVTSPKLANTSLSQFCEVRDFWERIVPWPKNDPSGPLLGRKNLWFLGVRRGFAEFFSRFFEGGEAHTQKTWFYFLGSPQKPKQYGRFFYPSRQSWKTSHIVTCQ